MPWDQAPWALDTCARQLKEVCQMHAGKGNTHRQPSPDGLAIRKQDKPSLLCAASRTDSLKQTLIRMDGCFPPWDWKKAWKFS